MEIRLCDKLIFKFLLFSVKLCEIFTASRISHWLEVCSVTRVFTYFILNIENYKKIILGERKSNHAFCAG